MSHDTLIKSIQTGIESDCDTINYPFPPNWSLTYYMVGSPAGDGYVSGTNDYNNKQIANYFDLSDSSFLFIYGASFYFGVANSRVAANLSKNLLFKIYTDSAGTPRTQIGSTVELPLASIKADVAAGNRTNIFFPSPLALPSSKKFYVSVDISNFTWIDGDSIALYTTELDEVNPGTAWVQISSGEWKNMNYMWGNLELIILPYAGISATSCSLLPVKLLSFEAEKSNNSVLLSWQVSDENNMKAYEIQKANNDNYYKPIAIIPARNTLKNQHYSFIDSNALVDVSSIQYRLKQVDNDGNIQYSKVISLQTLSTNENVVFPNPFNNLLKLQIKTNKTEMVTINIYNIQGSLMNSEKHILYKDVTNTINIASAPMLNKGIYFLKFSIGSNQFIYKIIKE